MKTASHPVDPALAPDLWAEPDDRADLRTNRRGSGVAFAALALVCTAAMLLWWSTGTDEADTAAPVASATIAAPDPAVVAAPAGPRFPLAPADTGPIAADGVAGSLQALFGGGAVGSFFLLDQFPRRLVATVDNLGREHAPASMWPVRAASDRFTVSTVYGSEIISADNGRRYQPWVDLLADVDARAAAQWYRRIYPLLQQAYRDLGFGDRYFNDRIVEVIDLMLDTPVPQGPVAVQLTQVHGPIASLQPWTRYEFADPELESLAAGQKVLLRLAPEQRAVVLDKLRKLRAQIVAGR